ncbi:hypothetical protein CR513_00735 [Mucuna pruriens]|uniref:SAM-dependent MTase RsmB/NOP-type domain-containing protein n=1 Tax=Mucuna pruriens TaxID=157652 RepID=A0A371IGQ6_MUCPR|nr:hypothetical protein CR513_00735 [Mucuna pruriens]
MEDYAAKVPLPDAFLQFLEANGLDPSIYTAIDSTPRYIRLKPGFEACIEDVEAEVKCKLDKLEWLPAFYSLPPHVQIAGSRAYRQGKIYGIDAASGAAVMALNLSPGDHVLDLCAAPGAKLCMILDLLGDSGSVTGVDVARHRLAACRTMLQKYMLGDRCRLFLFLADFILTLNHYQTGKSGLEERVDVFKEWTSRRPWKERKRANKSGTAQLVSRSHPPELIYYGQHSGVVGLTKEELFKTLSDNEIANHGYDKVLVDAECTHDGSIKHIQKFEHWGWRTLQHRVLDAERTDDLHTLQATESSHQRFQTAKSWRVPRLQHLQVPFTSLTVAQNEKVVEQFLKGNRNAELTEIDASRNWPCKGGCIPKTWRFDPLTSQTSGLFVAKFTKISSKEEDYH